MGSDYGSHNYNSQSAAACFKVARSVTAIKTFEDGDQLLGIQPFTGIFDRKRDLAFAGVSANCNDSTFRGMAQRVGQQIEEYLAESKGVERYFWKHGGFVCNGHAFFSSQRANAQQMGIRLFHYPARGQLA